MTGHGQCRASPSKNLHHTDLLCGDSVTQRHVAVDRKSASSLSHTTPQARQPRARTFDGQVDEWLDRGRDRRVLAGELHKVARTWTFDAMGRWHVVAGTGQILVLSQYREIAGVFLRGRRWSVPIFE